MRTFMDEIKAFSYEAPRVIDYGDLNELTAACLGGTGGDAYDPSGKAGGYTVGASNPSQKCTSNP
jgi:hypothetical protein